MKRIYLGSHSGINPLNRFDLDDRIVEHAKIAKEQVEGNKKMGWRTVVDIPLSGSVVTAFDGNRVVNDSQDGDESPYMVHIEENFMDPQKVTAEIGYYTEMGFDTLDDGLPLDLLDPSTAYFGEGFLHISQHIDPGNLIIREDRELFLGEQAKNIRIQAEREARNPRKESL